MTLGIKIPHVTLTRAAIWTTISFGFIQVIRLATNIVVTQLLAPELFGLMVIANAFKNGIELISDMGIGQSIVHNKNADDPEFYNTSWTLQWIRGIVLWALAVGASAPISYFYQTPILAFIIPIASFVLVFLRFYINKPVPSSKEATGR